MDVYEPGDFESALREITSGGRYFFLEEQLYYLFCARRASFTGNLKARFTRRRPGAPKRAIFHQAFRDYARANEIPLLLRVDSEFEFRGRSEPDLLDYAFDFLIVVEKSEFARLLLANQFHFHHRAAIVSRDGFPAPVFEHFRSKAREHADIPVICLHDASPRGLSLREYIRKEWFGESESPRTILDAGFRPRDFLERTERLFTVADPDSGDADASEHASYSREYRELLSPRELAFLDRGNRVELANLGPRHLMTLLGRYLRRRKREQSVFFREELDASRNG